MRGRLMARTWTVAAVCIVVATLGRETLAKTFFDDFPNLDLSRWSQLLNGGVARDPYGIAVLTVIQDPEGNTGTFNINVRLWDDAGIGVPAQTPGLLDFVFKTISGTGGATITSTPIVVAPYGEVDDGSLVYYGGGFSNKDGLGIRYAGQNYSAPGVPIPNSYNAVGLQPVAYAPDSGGADLLRDAAILYGVGTTGRTIGAPTQNGIGTWTSDPGTFAGDTPLIYGQYNGTGGIAITTYGVDSFDVLPGGPTSIFVGPLTDANTFGRPVKAVVTQWTTGIGNDGGAASANPTMLTVEVGNVVLTNANMGHAGVTKISSGATLQLGTGATGKNGSVGGAGIENNGVLAFNNFEDQSYLGPISGGGALTKSGPGRLTLSEANLYTGATTVNGGALKVTGSIDSSAVTVNNAGTVLTGDGSVKSLTINAGAVVAPGSSVGTLEVVAGNAALAAGAVYEWELGSTTADLVDITGNLALTSGWTVTLMDAGGKPQLADQFNLFTFTGAFTGTVAGIIDAGATGWDISSAQILLDNSVPGAGRVYISGIVPEPATLSLLALGGLAMIRRRRK